jgi:histidyl-tRNA synthetase
VDTVGAATMLADAEIVAVIDEVLSRLGFSRYTIRLNDRKLLTGLAQYAGVPPQDAPDVFRAIDKLDKIGLAGVRGELLTRIPPELQAARTLAAEEKPEAPERVPFLAEPTADRILDLIAIRGPADETLAALGARLAGVPSAAEGIAELTELVGYLRELGVPDDRYQVDLALARGLDYYTGPIFETEVEQEAAAGRVGSVTGGGRYDQLIGLFTDRSLPATGTTIGLERIIDVIEELGLAPAAARRSVTAVLVTVFNRDLLGESLRLVRDLRAAGLNAEVALALDSLGSQLRYASRKGVPFAVILGPEEARGGQVVLRNLEDGSQETLPRASLVERLQGQLRSP